MYRSFLSLRYLRARRANWIGTAGITVAVGALILILSIMSGFLDESRSHLRGSLADVIIQPRFEAPMPDGSLLPKDPEPLLELIRAQPGVAAACPQMQWLGMISQPGKAHALRDPRRGDIALVKLIGIDFEDEYQTSDLRQALTNEPLYPVERVDDVSDPFAAPPGYRPSGRPLASIIIGEQLAVSWGMHRGDEIEIVTTSIDPETGQVKEPSNQRYVVAGTFRSGENETDMQRVYFDRRELSDLLGEQEAYSTILIKLEDYERDKLTVVPAIAWSLHDAGFIHNPAGRYAEVFTWEDLKRTFLAAVENEKTLMGVMLSLVMIVAGFTVFAILSMMVTEKRRDIGILCALGSTPGGILGMFLMVAFWQAIVGATLGAVIGVVAAWNIDPIERWLSRTLNIQIFDRTVYYFDHIPSVVDVAGVALIVLGAFSCTLLFAAIPAYKAARMHPIDALRYE